MAKGLEKHQQRQSVLSSFGKNLARRSGRKCELCGSSGVALSAYELLPEPAEPEYENCIFICEECSEQLRKPSKIQAEKWRGLIEVIWSEVPAVQVMAGRVLTYLSKEHGWAQEILDEAYLDEETQESIAKQAL